MFEYLQIKIEHFSMNWFKKSKFLGWAKLVNIFNIPCSKTIIIKYLKQNEAWNNCFLHNWILRATHLFINICLVYISCCVSCYDYVLNWLHINAK